MKNDPEAKGDEDLRNFKDPTDLIKTPRPPKREESRKDLKGPKGGLLWSEFPKKN